MYQSSTTYFFQTFALNPTLCCFKCNSGHMQACSKFYHPNIVKLNFPKAHQNYRYCQGLFEPRGMELEPDVKPRFP